MKKSLTGPLAANPAVNLKYQMHLTHLPGFRQHYLIKVDDDVNRSEDSFVRGRFNASRKVNTTLT